MPSKSITILGSGLTGLTTAFRLSQLYPQTSASSPRITLIDSQPRIGGWVNSTSHRLNYIDKNGTYQSGEVVLESGPRSIRPRGSKGAVQMLRLIKDVGLEGDILGVGKTHDAAKNRFILDLDRGDGKLQMLPSSIPSLLSILPRSPLLRAATLGLLSEPFRSRRKGIKEDESIDTFLRRRFGSEIAKVATAGMHGIYAASTSDLSAQAILGSVWELERDHGSVLWGLIRRDKKGIKAESERKRLELVGLGELGKEAEGWSMYGLKGGIASLTERLGVMSRDNGVEMKLGEGITGLKPIPEGVEISTPTQSFETSHLICTIPPFQLSSLLPSSAPLPGLTSNPSTSVAVINLVYPLPPSQIHPSGFGYLIPKPTNSSSNPHGILGVVFDSTALHLDDNLNGQITKLTIMIGGPYWSTYPSSNSSSPLKRPTNPKDLIQPAVQHLQSVFPVLKTVDPVSAVANIHDNAIPTYTPGHVGRLVQTHRGIKNGVWDGKLSLAGNGLGGVGVNDCVLSAEGIVQGLREGKVLTGLEGFATGEEEAALV